MDTPSRERLIFWRILLLVGGVAVAAIHLTSPSVAGLGIQRAGLGLMYMTAVVALGTGLGRRWAQEIFSGTCYITAAWVLLQSALRPMSPESAIFLVITSLCMALVLPSLVTRLLFLGAMWVGLAGVVWMVPPVGVSASAVMVPFSIVLVVLGAQSVHAERVAREVGELSLVTSRVHNGVALLDRSGEVEWVNESFVKLAGEPSQAVVGRPLDEVLGEGGATDGLERLLRAIERGQQASVELPHRSALGTVTWVSLDLTPLRDRSGQVNRFVAVETDISRARAFLAQVLDSMSDMLLVVQDGRGIRSANASACRLLGRSEAELVGLSLEDFLDAGSRSPAAQGARRLNTLLRSRSAPAPGSEFEDLDLEFRRLDGELVSVQASAAVLTQQEEQPRLVVIVARDVRERLRMQTERRALEEKSRQGQKLESLGVLAGGIAHDFNNLLVGMLGNASLALALRPEDEELVGLLTRVERSAQRAADLTRQMLAYSGKGRFEVSTFALKDIVEEISDLIDASVSKQADLKLEFAADLSPVEGDVTQIRQVVMNLLTNASEALAEGGGQITISGRQVRLEAQTIGSLVVASESMQPGEYVELMVSDTGIGMDRHTSTRMFDPFFSTKTTGRGLGLAATLGIVRGHGGGLSVRSWQGRGTSVSIYLPVASGPGIPDSPETDASLTWAGRGAVLVVDDEPEVRDFIETVLLSTGLEVVTARDGQECVEVFAARRDEIGLVVLDLTMPRMNGDEALRRLREMEAELPVILSSGYDREEAVSRLRDHGAVVYLQKPYRAARLIQLVREQFGDAKP